MPGCTSSSIRRAGTALGLVVAAILASPTQAEADGIASDEVVGKILNHVEEAAKVA